MRPLEPKWFPQLTPLVSSFHLDFGRVTLSCLFNWDAFKKTLKKYFIQDDYLFSVAEWIWITLSAEMEISIRVWKEREWQSARALWGSVASQGQIWEGKWSDRRRNCREEGRSSGQEVMGTWTWQWWQRRDVPRGRYFRETRLGLDSPREFPYRLHSPSRYCYLLGW